MHREAGINKGFNMNQFKRLLKLSKYLENSGHFSELSALDGLIKTASKKDAKYLMSINLRALRKDMPKKEGEAPREYYSMLNEMAKMGPYFSKDALDFIRDNIDENFIDVNRKEFIKWLGEKLNVMGKHQYPSINDISMIKDWLVGTGWPGQGPWEAAGSLSAYSLDYAIVSSREWHEEASGPMKRGREREKPVLHTSANGISIVYEPTAKEDPIARINLGKKLGLCLANGLYSDDSQGKIYSVRSATGKPGACIRIQDSTIRELKGPGNRASAISVENAIEIKNWFKEEGFDFGSMGKSDFDQLPPTTWEEAFGHWQKYPRSFLQKGWFRGYRNEFRPYMQQLLEITYRGKNEDHGDYNPQLQRAREEVSYWLVTRDFPGLVSDALASGAHHIYTNLFSDYLNDIAKTMPEIYLRNNLPKTYSSNIYNDAHNDAINSMAINNPSQLLYFTSSGRTSVRGFSEKINSMLRAKTELAMTKLLEHVEGPTYAANLVDPDPSKSDGKNDILPAFSNNYALKTYPKIAEKMVLALDAAYAKADLIRGDRSDPGYLTRRTWLRTYKSVSDNLDLVKELIKTRAYRESPVFKRITDQTFADLQEKRQRAPRRTDHDHLGDITSMSFFELGLHNTKEYKALTLEYAELAVQKMEEVSKDDDKWYYFQDIEDRLLKLKSVPVSLKKRIMRHKLKVGGPDRYLQYSKMRLDPAYADITEEAVEGLLQIEADLATLTPPGAMHAFIWRLPGIIRNTEGIISPDLTAKIKEAFSKNISVPSTLRSDSRAAKRFWQDPRSAKEYPEEIKVILNQFLRTFARKELDPSLSLTNDRAVRAGNENYSRVMTSMREIQYTGLSVLRKVKSLGVENEIQALPDFIGAFSAFNTRLADLVGGRIESHDYWSAEGNDLSRVRSDQMRLITGYLATGMHKVLPDYDEKLSSAIEESNATLYPAIRLAYHNKGVNTPNNDIFSWWKIFGAKTAALDNYYYSDQDYPEGLYEKDSEFINLLYEELTKRERLKPNQHSDARGQDHTSQDFVYGFMYWSIKTFDSMGEHSDDPDLIDYLDHMNYVWPKRSDIYRDDKAFREGFMFRDKIERARYPLISRPVSYEEEEVSQQISSDYFGINNPGELSDETLDRIDHERLQARLDKRRENRRIEDGLPVEQMPEETVGPRRRLPRFIHVEDEGLGGARTVHQEGYRDWEDEDEGEGEGSGVLEDYAEGSYEATPEDGLVYRGDRLARLTSDNLSSVKRARIMRTFLRKISEV